MKIIPSFIFSRYKSTHDKIKTGSEEDKDDTKKTREGHNKWRHQSGMQGI